MEEKNITPEEATKVLREEKEKNRAACAVEIEEALKKYGLKLTVTQVIQITE